jgi:hypothetical protein
MTPSCSIFVWVVSERPDERRAVHVENAPVVDDATNLVAASGVRLSQRRRQALIRCEKFLARNKSCGRDLPKVAAISPPRISALIPMASVATALVAKHVLVLAVDATNFHDLA